MEQNFLMPKLGLTMTEGVLVEWSVKPGERFRKDQTVYVVETDKAANEIAAECDGRLVSIAHDAGATVAVGGVLGVWDDGMVSSSSPVQAPAHAAPAARPAASDAIAVPARPAGLDAASVLPDEPRFDVGAVIARPVATPLARRLARQHGIDLARIGGRGPRGRIEAADVEAALTAPTPASALPSVPGGHRVAPTSIQAAMARRLVAAKQEVPHFYLALDVDVSRLLLLRIELNRSGGTRVTINHFIVAALGRALVDEPQANRVWQAEALQQFESSDVGVAVHTERGLFVPVVRQAGMLGLRQLAREAHSLAEQARAGRLSAADMAGGAVTVSNAGMFNVSYMTPIINPGQAMILGVGSVKDVFRPDEAGQPVLRREMGLVLACDHRVLDGVSGLRFLNRVAHYLSDPLQLCAGP